MVKIIADTSTLFSPSQASDLGIDVMALSVMINNQSYAELVDMSSQEFLKLIRAGGIPTSSQPPIGKVVEAFEKNKHEDTIGIFMCDGLSGTYQSALSAKEMVEDNEKIAVIDSRTLCGPHRYIVLKAKELADAGKSKEEILDIINVSIANSKSFLLPQDFGFLKRGGRLTPLAATVGGMLKIVPIMTQTEDRKRLEKFGIGRTYMAAVGKVISQMKADGVDEHTYITVSHGGCEKQAILTMNKIKESYPNSTIELFELTPAFITQGGPDCVAIQWVK